jgi:hypothetical protein
MTSERRFLIFAHQVRTEPIGLKPETFKPDTDFAPVEPDPYDPSGKPKSIRRLGQSKVTLLNKLTGPMPFRDARHRKSLPAQTQFS